MFTAPVARVAASLHSYPDGDRGNLVTLRVMRQMVRRYRTHPAIRAAAISVIYTTPERDYAGEVGALFEFVRDGIRYTRDVTGVETLATPVKTLQLKIGDCDDKATLLATLLESVGHRTRFVLAGYGGAGAYQHVYLQVQDRGQWISLDPTEPYCVGWAPANASRMHVERI